MQLDFIVTPQTPHRGVALVKALFNGARRQGLSAKIVTRPREGAVAVLYGIGGVDRLCIARRHMSTGGHVVAWDAGYWGRDRPEPHRPYRVSIDGFHSPQLVLMGKTPSPDRWLKAERQITEAGDPDGPILLIGNGPKSNAVVSGGWTERKAKELRETFPGKTILYRPKPCRTVERGIDCDGISSGPIEQELPKASLVVCRHSNVAVDACMQGVPVVCDDGAAACIYPGRLADYENQPSRQEREEFLHRLAWWQWTGMECTKGHVWPWILKVLNEV